MWENYLKTAWRNFRRNAAYTLLTLVGLVVGLASAVMILLWVTHEWSYDLHHEKHERIWRLESHFTIQGKEDHFGVTARNLAPAMKVHYPQVEAYARFTQQADREIIKYGDRDFFVEGIVLADSTVFDVFTHPMIAGNPAQALTEPNTMVLTESLAKRIFGKENPIGQELEIGNGGLFQITGVIEDVPEASHFRFKALLSMITRDNMLKTRIGEEAVSIDNPNTFWNVDSYSYVLFREGYTAEDILSNWQGFYDKYMKAVGDQIGSTFMLGMTPLAENHLNNTLEWDVPAGNRTNIQIMIAVGIFLLLIACINYMNMATARALNRAREIAMRKIVGATSDQLRVQFLFESVILALAAWLLSLALVELSLPLFNDVSGRMLDFGIVATPGLFLLTLALAMVVALVAGAYPAFYLAAVRPLRVLRGKRIKEGSSGFVRKMLVTFQFALSIFMITGSGIVWMQLSYMRSAPLGFDSESMMIVTVQDTVVSNRLDAFTQELKNLPGVLAIGKSTSVPGEDMAKLVHMIEIDTVMVEKPLSLMACDYDYLDVLGVSFLEGRNFKREMSTDPEEAVIINQALAREYGWDKPIGKKISIGPFEKKVVGVIADFHFQSLHFPVQPVVIHLRDHRLPYLHIRLQAGNPGPMIDRVRKVYDSYRARYPFEYTFLQDNLNSLYDEEEHVGVIVLWFTAVSIILACLGLLALSAFSTRQRTREIGVRKVMGASVGDIVRMLMREVSILLGISAVIAIPTAWWMVRSWLQDFAYAIALPSLSNPFPASILIFVGSVVLVFVTAWGTVGWHAYFTANLNPVVSLREE